MSVGLALLVDTCRSYTAMQVLCYVLAHPGQVEFSVNEVEGVGWSWVPCGWDVMVKLNDLEPQRGVVWHTDCFPES